MLLSELISVALPAAWTGRHSVQNKIIPWTNSLLRRLSMEGFLPKTDREIGVIVKDGFWIDMPNNISSVKKIFHPQNRSLHYYFSEVNGRVKLEKEFEEQDYLKKGRTDFDTGTNQLLIEEHAAEEDLSDVVLICINGGSVEGFANYSVIVKSYSEDNSNHAVCTPLHPNAYSDLGIISGIDCLIYDKYLLAECSMEYKPLSKTGVDETDTAQELPVNEDYTDILVKGLRYLFEQDKSGEYSNEVKHWQIQYENAVSLYKNLTRTMGEQRIKPRSMPGIEQIKYNRYF